MPPGYCYGNLERPSGDEPPLFAQSTATGAEVYSGGRRNFGGRNRRGQKSRRRSSGDLTLVYSSEKS